MSAIWAMSYSAEADILEGASHVPVYLLEPDEPPE